MIQIRPNFIQCPCHQNLDLQPKHENQPAACQQAARQQADIFLLTTQKRFHRHHNWKAISTTKYIHLQENKLEILEDAQGRYTSKNTVWNNTV